MGIINSNKELIAVRIDCNERNFNARFIAHYIDNDFSCCNMVM